MYFLQEKYMHATKKYTYATKNICMLQKTYVCKKNICARIFGKLIWSLLAQDIEFHYAVGFLLITQKL